MRKLLLLFAAALFVAGAVSAADKLSLQSSRFLDKWQKKSAPSMTSGPKVRSVSPKNVGGVESIQCFVMLENGNTSDIVVNGGVVNAMFGDKIALATIPVENVRNLANCNSVRQIQIAKPKDLKTDVARNVTRSELVWDGLANGLPEGFDGTDVVVGLIDDGIEYNHRAFKDDNGNLRVKRVYEPNSTASTGSQVTINGNTLSGRQYTTATEIAQRTTDDTSESHGTHTTGCAGGSIVGKYSGMAPNVDLVLCGCGEQLTDAAISQSALYIAEYAKSVGKPCVISISLGSDVGPHDGTSALCQVYDAIAQEYNAIILLAAGNEADVNGSLIKPITTSSTSTPGLATVWAPTSYFGYYIYSYSLYGELDIWNNSSNPLSIEILVLDSSGNVKTSTGKVQASANGVELVKNKTAMASYFDTSESTLKVYSGVDEANNRYNVFLDADLSNASYGTSYTLGILIYGSEGDVVSMWTDAMYTELKKKTVSGYTFTAGNPDCSICDDVTGHKTISVGAWCSRLTYPTSNGSSTSTESNSPYALNDIAYFSSYGTDYNGVNHPCVSAPGHTVVSSINRYTSPYSGAYRVSVGSGSYDYWDNMSGTSMATPVAAGVVALWRQINPELTVDDIKDVIAQTAIHDTHMPEPSVRWGQGKIDALGGAQYIIESMGDDDYTPGDVNNDGSINVFDVVSTSLFMIDQKKGRFIFKAADLNEDGVVDVADLTGIVNLSLGIDANAAQAPAYVMARPGAFTAESIEVEPFSLKAGESRDVVVKLNNGFAYSAMQFDLNLPAGVTASNVRMSSRAGDHTVSFGQLRNGNTRILAYSPSNDVIEGSEGAVLTFTLTASPSFNPVGEMLIDNIVLSTAKMERKTLNAVAVPMGAGAVTAVDRVTSQLTVYAAGENVIVESPCDQTVTIASTTGAYRTVRVKAGRNVVPMTGRGMYIVKVADKAIKVNVTK